jgi:hypothetical protein
LRLKVLIAGAAVAALGAVVGAIWVGSQVREDTVVASPYEEGLQHDAEHHAKAALGWTVAVSSGPLAPRGPLAFELRDRAGAPLAGATVTVAATPAESGRGGWTATAREEGGGRYVADAAFAGAGAWELRLDVRRGADRARLAAPVTVAAGATACRLDAGPCPLDLGGGAIVTLELGPRPLRTMADLAVEARLTRGGAPVDGASIAVSFEMAGMSMGPNRSVLAPAGEGRYSGKAVLVRCPSGRRDWAARVVVTEPGRAAASGETELRVAE